MFYEKFSANFYDELIYHGHLPIHPQFTVISPTVIQRLRQDFVGKYHQNGVRLLCSYPIGISFRNIQYLALVSRQVKDFRLQVQ